MARGGEHYKNLLAEGLDPMTTKPETRLVKQIRAELESRGWLVWKIHGGPYQEPGIPDLLCVRDGRLLGVEAKMPGKHPTAIQRRQMDRMRAAGAAAIVVHSVDELREHLDQLTEAVPHGS